MSLKDSLKTFGKKFKLDSHHAIERFGVVVGGITLSGVLIASTAGASAFSAHREDLADKALYTTEIETSKTKQSGQTVGVYTNEAGDRAFVMMKFSEDSSLSYDAADYRAFLLGSDLQGKTGNVQTQGVVGSTYVFGTTGYLGVLLEAEEPFAQQILNLTMRAEAELAYSADGSSSNVEEEGGDPTFQKYDQWRMYINPGARDAVEIPALESSKFNAAEAYYDIAVSSREADARQALDDKLGEMRASLTQIEAYSTDLRSARTLDGLSLLPPTVPETIRDDQVTAPEEPQETAAPEETEAPVEDPAGMYVPIDTESEGLELETGFTVPGGVNFSWRHSTVLDGYMKDLVEDGESYAEFFDRMSSQEADDTRSLISEMEWTLSDGTPLLTATSDDLTRDVTRVMNNLSQAYDTYYAAKQEYQTTLLMDLLRLDVEVSGTATNTTSRTGSDVVAVMY